MASNQQRFLALPFLLGLVGVLFSVWHLWGDSSVLCITEGCSLFQDFEIAGISMWWLGLAGCAVLALAAVPGFSGVGVFLAGAGLLLDCVLLAVMLTTAPCFSCLLIGALLALLFVVYRGAARFDRRQRPPYPTSWLLVVWTLLFLLNLGSLVNAEAGPWALPSSGRAPAKEAAIQVYFSPSCAACLELVASTPRRSEDGDNGHGIAWYPVEEEPRDVWIIAALKRRMDNGEELAPALEAAIAETPAAISPVRSVNPSLLLMQYRTWRNKAHVLNSGSSRLPFVEFRGAPSFMMNPSQPTVPSSPPPARPFRPVAPSSLGSGVAPEPAVDASLLQVDAFCDGSTGEPCEEPSPERPTLSDIMSAPAP